MGVTRSPDSALIELTEKPNHPLTEVKFGDSAQMAPGDWVVAIGNPFGLDHTVSVGRRQRHRGLTDRRRPLHDFLQTDAAINPGNSGGPLLNVRGEVIGIDTAIDSVAAAGQHGIGFAIPINVVRELLRAARRQKITRGVIARQGDRRAVDALEGSA